MVWLPFIIFPYIGNNHPYWLIFFRGVQSTNQSWKSVVIPGCGLVRWIQPLWHPHLAPWHRGTSAQAQPRWKMTMMRVCQRRSSNLPFGEFLCHSCNTKYAIHVWVICWDGLIWYDSSHFSSWNVCVYIYIYTYNYTHMICVKVDFHLSIPQSPFCCKNDTKTWAGSSAQHVPCLVQVVGNHPTCTGLVGSF